MLVDIEQQAARQQLSNFLAVLCDGLGVPRHSTTSQPLTLRVAGQEVRLPKPTVAQRPAPNEALVQWHIRDEFLRELQQHVKRN